MLTTPHFVIGLVIIKIFPNPYLGFLFCIISHFLLDFFVPHWNPHIYSEFKKNKKISLTSLKIIIFDVLISSIIFLFLAYKLWPNYFLILTYGFGAFFAILPDSIEIPFYFLNSKNKCLAKYVNIQHKYQASSNFFWGSISQILVVMAGVYELFS